MSTVMASVCVSLQPFGALIFSQIKVFSQMVLVEVKGQRQMFQTP